MFTNKTQIIYLLRVQKSETSTIEQSITAVHTASRVIAQKLLLIVAHQLIKGVHFLLGNHPDFNSTTVRHAATAGEGLSIARNAD